jgi:hypothetical protein
MFFADRVDKSFQLLQLNFFLFLIIALTHFHNEVHLYLTNSEKMCKAALLVGVVVAIDVPAVRIGALTDRLQQCRKGIGTGLMTSTCRGGYI